MEDDWLFIHRDSSGFCIYQVRVDRINDEYDKQMLGWIIECLLLDNKRSVPLVEKGPVNWARVRFPYLIGSRLVMKSATRVAAAGSRFAKTATT